MAPAYKRPIPLVSDDCGERRAVWWELYRYLQLLICHLSERNIEKIKASLEDLTSAGYIGWEQSGRTHHLTVNPKETEIKIPAALAKSIINHNYSSEEQVAWEQVLKLYIWVVQNYIDIVTNRIIAAALSTSESTVCSAKKVLVKEYEAITKRKISERLGDDCFRTLGQELRACAWWKDTTE